MSIGRFVQDYSGPGDDMRLRIRDLREDRDLTQQKVADYLHVKQNTYSQYEIGVLNYPVEVLIKLAVFYDVSMDYLVGLTDDPTPPKRTVKKEGAE